MPLHTLRSTAGPSVTELPGWRVGILFLLFLVITVTWDRGIA